MTRIIQRAPRNRTLHLLPEERKRFSVGTYKHAETLSIDKQFGENGFRKKSAIEYEKWLKSWGPELKRLLKSNGSIYICGDWRSSSSIERVLSEHSQIAQKAKDFLNLQSDFLSLTTARSTRAVGDALCEILGENFENFLGDSCTEYSTDFARRAMADLAFKDAYDCYYVVDVKTHREDSKFNMPNLTSVERLARFYENDLNFFVLLLIKYRVENVKVQVPHVDFVPIEFLDWDCLTIGALGWGQIQIANSNRIGINPDSTLGEMQSLKT